jgi:hypothetical protein
LPGNNTNNIRLLETTDKPQSLDNNVRINVDDGQSPPRQLRVSSLPTAVTRWGDIRPRYSCHDRAPNSDASIQSPARYQLRHRASECWFLSQDQLLQILTLQQYAIDNFTQTVQRSLEYCCLNEALITKTIIKTDIASCYRKTSTIDGFRTRLLLLLLLLLLL